MATLTVQSAPARAGINLTTAAVAVDVAGSDKFLNDGATHVAVLNLSASPLTVTIDFSTNAAVDGVTPTNKTVTVPAGDYTILGPFPTNLYNDANNYTTLAWSATTTIKVLAYKAK